MKKATVTELRYHFPRVERLLADSESVEITKRGRVIARFARPDAPAAKPEKQRRQVSRRSDG